MTNIVNYFPFHMLPPSIRDAVWEAGHYVKAPTPLIASSAFGAISLACQGLVDVERPRGLVGPTSLFLLTIAESGERKTSADKEFMAPIVHFEDHQTQKAVSALAKYEAAIFIWNLKKKSLSARILQLEGKGSQDDDELELQLSEHLVAKPQRPRTVKWIFGNTSPEALAKSMHAGSSSVGLMADEGSQILNGRAAGDLPLINDLWGGGTIRVDRSNSDDSFSVKDARITISGMVQQKSFGKFLSGRGALARDNGFLSRCLINDPQSTQGFREDYSLEKPKQPALEAFRKRLTEIMESSLAEEGSAGVERTVLTFSPNAKVKWVDFSNYIERNLGPGGALAEVRDAASKTAENVARMAALFHFFEGRTGEIQEDSVDQALRICEWYLLEFRRIFHSPPPIPQPQLDALEIDSWLRNYFRSSGNYVVQKNYVMQRGPNQMRVKERLDPALRLLTQAGRLTSWKDFSTKTWVVELIVHSPPYVV